MTEAGSGWEEITGNVATEVAGAFVPRHSRDFFLFLAFFWRAERQQPRQGRRVLRGAEISPDQKDSSVCVPFAQSDTDSIRLRVAAGLPPGGREGDQN